MKTVIKIEGMSCQHCVMAVKKEIEKLNVQKLDIKIGEAIVEFDESKVSEENIRQAIKGAGYIVSK